MPDLVITDIVSLGQRTVVQEIQFGEAITKADWLYRKASDGKYYQADNDVTAAEATVVGICLVGGALDAFGSMVTAGPVLFTGPTMDPLVPAHYLSSAAAKMMPEVDLATPDIVSYLGSAITALIFDVDIQNYGTVL